MKENLITTTISTMMMETMKNRKMKEPRSFHKGTTPIPKTELKEKNLLSNKPRTQNLSRSCSSTR